jgi:hypothetical protein|tara:strand:- start:2945 stop:3193 length:249 start_codon:yes stop_codon:yes gene_type:complete
MRTIRRERSKRVPFGLITITNYKSERNFLYTGLSEIQVSEYINRRFKEIGLSLFELEISEIDQDLYDLLVSGVITLRIPQSI